MHVVHLARASGFTAPSAEPMGVAPAAQRWGSWDTGAATAPQLWGPRCVPPMSPSTPGTEIRKNATNFGIPLSLQPLVGEVGVPIPVRTNSGMVYAPSPTAANSASFATGFSAAVSANASAQQASVNTTNMPIAGNRPFVTPFSAGLRVARTGGVGGA